MLYRYLFLILFMLQSSLLALESSAVTKNINQHNQEMQKISKEQARTAMSFDGYNYFKIAVQTMEYKEKYTYQNSRGTIHKGDVQENDFSGTNVVYMGGGLSRINDRYDFSMDSISTLAPQEIDETWKINGVVNQKDKASIDFTQVNILLHQKYGQKHRAVGGFEFKKMAFERYGFDALSNATIPETLLPLINIRERSSSLSMDAGYWYESKSVGVGGIRTMFKGLVKVPFWQRTENTAYPNKSFSDPSGYDFECTAEIAYTIYDNVELGLFGAYNYIYRNGENQGTLHWPSNTLTSYTTGISVNWKL
jgi:hypothetical protein